MANTSWVPLASPTPAPFRRRRRPEERVTVLGARMDLVKPAEVFHFIGRRIAQGQRTVIANHNLQSLALCRKDAELRAFFDRADLVEIDSIPLIAWARLLGHPARRFHRCTYLDWRDAFWSRAAQEGWRVFLLGGRPEVVSRAASRIAERHRGVPLAARPGYFDAAPGSAANAEAIEAIRRFRPDVLLVGMGMPRQELWVLRNLEALPDCAIFTVGGAFDYEAGAQVPCPRWIGALGLEWLFRLLLNPPRLFRRYCIEPWSLLPLVRRDLQGVFARRLPRRTA